MIVIRGMWGLGDNIYQRPFVRAATERYDLVYLSTPWPELYEDLPVRFVRREPPLRTQMKNINRQLPERWSPAPQYVQPIRLGYGHVVADSMVDGFRQCLALPTEYPLIWDLPQPVVPVPVRSGRKPIAVIRPVTLRAEWPNQARNPRPEYVTYVAARLRRTHHVIVIADLAPGEEWLEGELPPHDEAYLEGELDVKALIALCAAADVIAGPVGWIVPAAIAIKRKAFILLGGNGGHNAPEKLTDAGMDLSRIGFALPDRFCRCAVKDHQCDKTISDLDHQFETWANRVGLALSMSAPHAA